MTSKLAQQTARLALALAFGLAGAGLAQARGGVERPEKPEKVKVEKPEVAKVERPETSKVEKPEVVKVEKPEAPRAERPEIRRPETAGRSGSGRRGPG